MRQGPRGGVPVGLVLGAAVTCVGTSAIFVRWCESSAEAIAFWRLALASGMLAVPCLARSRARHAARRALTSPWTAGAGAFLAAHLILWNRAVAATSVAASTFLLAIQIPVAGLVSWLLLREPPGRRAVVGMGLTLGGIGVLAVADGAAHGLGSTVALGDALALASGVAYVGYVGIGRRVREHVTLAPYLLAVYGWAAAATALAAILLARPLAPSVSGDWPLLVSLALVPTLGGHGLFNYSLARVRVYVVNLAVMGEPVVASLLAALLLAEPPPAATWLAAPLIVLGAALALWELREVGERPHRPSGSPSIGDPVASPSDRPAPGPMPSRRRRP